MDSAVIFDVDGVLLELTEAEEDAFFTVFERRYGLTGLSRDWDSYRVRNDEHIIAEILDRHGLPPGDHDAVVRDYLTLLAESVESGAIAPIAIAGAGDLLKILSRCRLGIATANLLGAARIRLKAMNLWEPVCKLAYGAEGSAHKRETVARAIEATGLPKKRIVYIGDNLNDVDAGLGNGVHFIGFSVDPERVKRLRAAGATHLSSDHITTARLIERLLQ